MTGPAPSPERLRLRGWRAAGLGALVGLFLGVPAPGPRIQRLAGTGELAFNGDGKGALETAFYMVSAVRPGPDGRVWVMDYNNHRLRALGSDGKVTTVAGNGEHAFATPGFPATRSPLENPIDFAFGEDGRALIIPQHDPRVLVIREDGALLVAAGTDIFGDEGDGLPAARARFTELHGVAVGQDGSVYLSDAGAHRVRVLRPDGTVQAFAGLPVEQGGRGYSGDGQKATLARLREPEGLAVDAAGNVYIADRGNHVVRRVNVQGIIETVVGSGEAGFSGDGGPATAAQLRYPEGVAVKDDGTLYVSDSANARIRVVSPTGEIDTLAGTGDEGLSGDGGPAKAARLNYPSRLWLEGDKLYLADLRNSCARVIDLAAD